MRESADLDAYRDGGWPAVETSEEGPVVVLTLRGHLDAAAGAALLDAASAPRHDSRRLDIDLRMVESFTPEGARSLVACRTLAADLAEGLHYRTGRGPGREALLSAYAPQA